MMVDKPLWYRSEDLRRLRPGTKCASRLFIPRRPAFSALLRNDHHQSSQVYISCLPAITDVQTRQPGADK